MLKNKERASERKFERSSTVTGHFRWQTSSLTTRQMNALVDAVAILSSCQWIVLSANHPVSELACSGIKAVQHVSTTVRVNIVIMSVLVLILVLRNIIKWHSISYATVAGARTISIVAYECHSTIFLRTRMRIRRSQCMCVCQLCSPVTGETLPVSTHWRQNAGIMYWQQGRFADAVWKQVAVLDARMPHTNGSALISTERDRHAASACDIYQCLRATLSDIDADTALRSLCCRCRYWQLGSIGCVGVTSPCTWSNHQRNEQQQQ